MTETLKRLIGDEDREEATRRTKGPLAEDDTGEITTEDRLEALREENEKAARDLDDAYDDDDEEEEDGGLLELIGEHWRYVLGALVAIVVVYIALGWALGGTGEETNASQKASAAGQGVQETQVEDTGVLLEKPTTEDDGTYYLKAGTIAWKGEIEKTDDGEQLTLEGATAAQFKRAVNLPHGAITTGVFGRAEPDEPVVHATFHRTTIGEEEITTGTYHAMDGSRVLIEGKYHDERGGETVTRTYTEQAPHGHGQQTSYQISFQAPKDVPVPALIGWKPPAPAEGQK